MTTLWYRLWLFGSFNRPRLPSWIGFFTARWQWQHVRAAHARSSKQNTRANISVFCLHLWLSIRSRTINGFNKCVWLSFTLEGMIYKREGIWQVFRMALHISGIGVWRHDNSPWRAHCDVSIRQSPSLCNAILNTCPCLLATGTHTIHSIPHS